MRISVAIPTWRRADALARCLEGLERQGRKPDEVIVIVREDDAESRNVVAEHGGTLNVTMATVQEPGLVAALNRGLEAATDGVVAFTDDDTVPRVDWLERIERNFTEDPRLGGLGGRDWLHPPSKEADQVMVGQLRWYGRMVGNHHLGVGPPRPVDLLKGANMSYRLDALNGGRVDGRLRAAEVHTEIDLCLRIRQPGWKIVYDPAVAVDHYPAPRVEDDSRVGPVGATLEHVIHNETYLVLKWQPWLRRLAALVYWFVVGSRTAPGLLLLVERLGRESDRKSMLHRYRATLRGRWAGIRTFMGAR